MSTTTAAPREINSREIAGIGEVTWHLVEDDGGTYHRVQLFDKDGNELSNQTFTDGIDAHSCFDHMFASKTVPDVFAQAKG